jgi:uncharacterized protein YdiU (UPF0061 family)
VRCALDVTACATYIERMSGAAIMADSRPLFQFDNTYARLPDRFFARQAPTPVTAPRLIKINTGLARLLGIDAEALTSIDAVAALAGNQVPAGAEPIALAYAGHQFGGFVPQLGDGRAILLGEVVGSDGQRRDIQLKGSGPTPFSRRGDGRAAIGPVLREYVVSEAMAALGIPTTRTLAAVTTGEPVYREVALPGAVLTRVAASHIRVGTFQYFAVRRDVEGIRQLADYAITRHYPELRTTERPYASLLQSVAERQARLVARWLLVGFIHGVMNTDNCSIAGETIDYGPCAFLDAYDPSKVFSSIDHHGRYAYANQPAIAQWNVARLAETLLPILDSDEDRAMAAAQEAVNGFAGHFEKAYVGGLRQKLGLTVAQPDDMALAQDLLDRMTENAADFTLTFRRLADAIDPAGDDSVGQLFRDPATFREWAPRWRDRLAMEPVNAEARRDTMRAVNPAFIPRNHRIEQAIFAAVTSNDYGPFERLVRVLERPFDDQPHAADLAEPPASGEEVRQTFCGT